MFARFWFCRRMEIADMAIRICYLFRQRVGFLFFWQFFRLLNYIWIVRFIKYEKFIEHSKIQQFVQNSKLVQSPKNQCPHIPKSQIAFFQDFLLFSLTAIPLGGPYSIFDPATYGSEAVCPRISIHAQDYFTSSERPWLATRTHDAQALPKLGV